MRTAEQNNYHSDHLYNKSTKQEEIMNYKVIISVGVSMIIISIAAIAGSFFLASPLLMILSIIILVVSILFMFIMLTIDMFSKDKQLDIEALKKQGLTIITCNNCNRDNVLEDQYCIYCGEELNNGDEETV